MISSKQRISNSEMLSCQIIIEIPREIELNFLNLNTMNKLYKEIYKFSHRLKSITEINPTK